MFDELVALLAIVSPLAALMFGYFSFNHARKKQDQDEATKMTTVIVKLENIGDNVKDIKNELANVKTGLTSLSERVTAVELKVEQLENKK